MITTKTELPHLNLEVEEGLTVRDLLMMDLESTLFKMELIKGISLDELKKQNLKA